MERYGYPIGLVMMAIVTVVLAARLYMAGPDHESHYLFSEDITQVYDANTFCYVSKWSDVDTMFVYLDNPRQLLLIHVYWHTGGFPGGEPDSSCTRLVDQGIFR